MAEDGYMAVRGTVMVKVLGGWHHYTCVSSDGQVAELQELQRQCNGEFVLRWCSTSPPSRLLLFIFLLPLCRLLLR
jgi:hypothetical protein